MSDPKQPADESDSGPQRGKRVSLEPLAFEEALADLLATKPEESESEDSD